MVKAFKRFKNDIKILKAYSHSNFDISGYTYRKNTIRRQNVAKLISQ